MKRIILSIIAICLYYTTNAQTIGRSFMNNIVVKTEGYTSLELSFYNEKGSDVVHICDWYNELGSDELHFSSISNNINTIKAELNALQSKYAQWIATAKSNNVNEVEKEIPCKISYLSASCDKFTSPTSIVIKPYFIVHNHVPHCEIRIWQYFYNYPPNYNVWYLYPKDIPFIINSIDFAYKEYKTNSTEKKRTENLFQ